MIFSYKKLWKLLIDKDMTKQDLCEVAHLSSSTVAKADKRRKCEYGGTLEDM